MPDLEPTEASPDYPVSLTIWFDQDNSLTVDVHSPEQSDHWMQAFMADDWRQLRWHWNGALTQVVNSNPIDRYSPVILEVNQ